MDRINRINRIVVSGLKKEQDGSIWTQKKNNILIFSNPLFEFKDYYPNYSHPFRFFESRYYYPVYLNYPAYPVLFLSLDATSCYPVILAASSVGHRVRFRVLRGILSQRF